MSPTKIAVLAAAVAALTLTSASRLGAGEDKVQSNCTFRGKKLYGKVKIVDSFPDFKVKKVDSFPDLKVKFVDSFPDKCGLWKVVDSFPDFTIKWVDSFPDFKIKEVSSFPGMP